MRYIAFLRAINVGGRIVKMDELRRRFTMGFVDVETFIASGNVVFTAAKANDRRALETKIEKGLQAAFGDEVIVFVSSTSELAAIADRKPFSPVDVDAAAANNIGFLKERISQTARQNLMALQTEIDRFHADEREVYWLSHNRLGETLISTASLEKTLGGRFTFRGVNTIRRMTAKYCG